MLLKDYYYHYKQREDMVQRYIQQKDMTKHPNASIKLSSAEYTPLLLGQVQISKIHSSQQELLVEELMLRELIVNAKDLITKMKKILTHNEHPSTNNLIAKKYF